MIFHQSGTINLGQASSWVSRRNLGASMNQTTHRDPKKAYGEEIYSDVAFKLFRERHVRLVSLVFFVIIVLNGLGWAAFGYAFDFQFPLINLPFSAIALAILLASRNLSARLLSLLAATCGLANTWLFIILVEGIPAITFPSVNRWWFLPISAGCIFLFYDDGRWRFSVPAFGFISFMVCQFSLISFSPSFPIPMSAASMFIGLQRGLEASVYLGLMFVMYLFMHSISEADRQLENANNRLEALVSNMLPKVISKRLRKEGKTFADGYAECSVMFVDLVGFTELSSRMNPSALVALLDEIFSKFDELTEAAGLEKIKTIGDAYMVAAGVPERMPNHAQALALLALSLRSVIREYAGLQVRIGINSGQVVAGIIGKKKFNYDLWGDTVNIASRMESHGVVDEIQVSSESAEFLQPFFELSPRGEIHVKGRGPMTVYLIVGKKISDSGTASTEHLGQISSANRGQPST